MKFRVLVTGSRDWSDAEAIDTALSAMARGAAEGGYDGMTVVHGGASGADSLAQRWASLRRDAGQPVVPEPHPARWSRGASAGMERNREMVDLGADVCVAFVGPCNRPRCRRPKPHDSHGTAQCMRLAERAGIHVVSIRAGA